VGDEKELFPACSSECGLNHPADPERRIVHPIRVCTGFDKFHLATKSHQAVID
jgi:hypothetical protein